MRALPQLEKIIDRFYPKEVVLKLEELINCQKLETRE